MHSLSKLATARAVALVAAAALACGGRPATAPGAADAGTAAEAAAAPPNVVVIIADDLGRGDVCAYGCEQGRSTPNIDALAASGVRFDHGYVSAPVCSPSRAGLLSGRYQERFGHEFTVREGSEGTGTSLDEVLLPQLLKNRGYATGMVGKWHLGGGHDYHPLSRGFDEYFGFLYGANLYLDPLEGPGIHFAEAEPNPSRRARSESNPILRGREPVDEQEYLTEAFTREAVDFIARHRDRPFFLYLAYNAPHTPLQVTDRYYDRFPEIADERSRIFTAMVSALDDGVGAVMSALRDHGLEQRTLVVFLSDNGCATYTGACSNGPLLGGKLTHFEGGVRVPLLMQWPGTIAAGGVVGDPVSSLDVVPTVLAAVGGAPAPDRPLDGFDLLPLLRGETDRAEHDRLYWRNGENWAALHDGRYKMVHLDASRHFVYDLDDDLGESHDLSAEKPELGRQLREGFDAWSSQMSEPGWPVQRKVWASWEDLVTRERRLGIAFEPRPGWLELTL